MNYALKVCLILFLASSAYAFSVNNVPDAYSPFDRNQWKVTTENRDYWEGKPGDYFYLDDDGHIIRVPAKYAQSEESIDRYVERENEKQKETERWIMRIGSCAMTIICFQEKTLVGNIAGCIFLTVAIAI